MIAVAAQAAQGFIQGVFKLVAGTSEGRVLRRGVVADCDALVVGQACLQGAAGIAARFAGRLVAQVHLYAGQVGLEVGEHVFQLALGPAGQGLGVVDAVAGVDLDLHGDLILVEMVAKQAQA
jgi:hypothetical protein